MTIDSWTVELHGTLHNGLSRRSDKVIDEIQDDSLRKGNVVMWRNGETDIPLPSPDNHILFVFTHFLQHFFHGGDRPQADLRLVSDVVDISREY